MFSPLEIHSVRGRKVLFLKLKILAIWRAIGWLSYSIKLMGFIIRLSLPREVGVLVREDTAVWEHEPAPGEMGEDEAERLL